MCRINREQGSKIHEMGVIMTKAELVVKLSKTDARSPKNRLNQIFSTFVETIKTSLQKAERIALPGLGSFSFHPEKGENRKKPPHRSGDQDSCQESSEVLHRTCIEQCPQWEEGFRKGSAQKNPGQSNKEEKIAWQSG